jgi:hypothetical protein
VLREAIVPLPAETLAPALPATPGAFAAEIPEEIPENISEDEAALNE